MQIYADGKDITQTAGGLSWKNSTDEVSTTMSFSIAKDLSDKWTSTYLPKHGSIVSYITNAEVFRGIVLAVDDGDTMLNLYTVADFGFYLKKNKETYQFNGISANAAIEQMCSDFGIPVDSICDIGCTVKKIYLDKTIYDIIKDIFEIAKSTNGSEFNIDVTPKGVRIYKIGDIVAEPTFRLADNLPTAKSTDFHGPMGHKTSIEELYNAIKVITGNEDGFTQQAYIQNDESVNGIGRLQEVVKIEDKNKANASQIAQQKLKELCVEKEEFTIPIIEDIDSYTRAGSILKVRDVTFLIVTSEHSIERGTHLVTLGLQRRG